MMYKNPRVQAEFSQLAPKLLEKLKAFEIYSKARGYPEPTATHVLRYIEENGDIYYKEEMAKNPSLTEAEARAKAEARPTLHYHLCACDLRTYYYQPAVLRDCINWLRANCPSSEYEILAHDVGSGFHLHVGIRDRAHMNLHPASRKPKGTTP